VSRAGWCPDPAGLGGSTRPSHPIRARRTRLPQIWSL
jgi:hypothetical protein